jgi:hypothetical protein
MGTKQWHVTVSLDITVDADVPHHQIKEGFVAEARRYLAATQTERDSVSVEVLPR